MKLLKINSKKIISYLMCLVLLIANTVVLSGCDESSDDEVIVLRVSNW